MNQNQNKAANGFPVIQNQFKCDNGTSKQKILNSLERDETQETVMLEVLS
jgi:hypothetical protein